MFWHSLPEDEPCLFFRSYLWKYWRVWLYVCFLRYVIVRTLLNKCTCVRKISAYIFFNPPDHYVQREKAIKWSNILARSGEFFLRLDGCLWYLLQTEYIFQSVLHTQLTCKRAKDIILSATCFLTELPVLLSTCCIQMFTRVRCFSTAFPRHQCLLYCLLVVIQMFIHVRSFVAGCCYIISAFFGLCIPLSKKLIWKLV